MLKIACVLLIRFVLTVELFMLLGFYDLADFGINNTAFKLHACLDSTLSRTADCHTKLEQRIIKTIQSKGKTISFIYCLKQLVSSMLFCFHWRANKLTRTANTRPHSVCGDEIEYATISGWPE
jgi:hypothetical protein